MLPPLSAHFMSREPSAIRLSQIEFLKRKDKVTAVNTAIGNVSLPMHPAMIQRMLSLKESPFGNGVVQYSTTVGEVETNQAILHLIRCSGFSTQGLYSQITDGASHAMELVLLGVCDERPLLIFDPTYTNYTAFAKRIGRSTVALTRHLSKEGKFRLPSLGEIEETIQRAKPSALLVIPYDNPSGQFFPQEILDALGKLCVKYNLWMISDEAYRELFYTGEQTSSIWGVTESKVPGITGRRISIESASKVWNACGLRVGAIVTDNQPFHQQAVAENTANLGSNALGQYIFAALLHESKEQLQSWYQKQRAYYREMANDLIAQLRKALPQAIISSPDASLYTVIDLRDPTFDATDFVLYCAKKGKVMLNGTPTTLLVAPMQGFYSTQPNPGKTQMRIAYVEPPKVMAQVPGLLAQLLSDYLTI
jgi:aspartate aminotransferase